MALRPRPVSRRMGELAAALGVSQADLGSTADVVISGISLDSRRIVPGDIYAALSGANVHGAQFVDHVAQAGAAVILTDSDGRQRAEQTGLPVVVVDDPRAILGQLSAEVYGNPAEQLAVIGITGTDGKTTTAMLCEAAASACGLTTGLIGTVATRIGQQEVPAIRTTPEAPDLQALLAAMVEAGVDVVAMEVSSHALALGRVDGVVFDVAVFTNLGHDHLDFHGTQTAYFETKAELFTSKRSRRQVICVDDQWGHTLAERTQRAQTYSVPEDLTRGSADWTVDQVAAEGIGWSYQLHAPIDDSSVNAGCRLPGVFNLRNAVAAVAALTSTALPITVEQAAQAVAQCDGVPGRMQAVDAGQEFAIVVDYAHTPDAVERALSVGRQAADRNGGRLLVALGCGGDRDTAKRPVMGRLAAQVADVAVITDDNPRSELPADIRRAMLAGMDEVPNNERAEVIEMGDRRQALATLVERAQSTDVVMVLGKGHETGQDVAGVISPFDDRRVLAEQVRVRLGVDSGDQA